MRLIAVALVLVIVLAAALLAAAWAWQERLVWQPPAAAVARDARARRLEYRADDGQPLHAWLVGDPSRARGLLIAFHGNAEIAAWNLPWAAEVERRTGWAVLVPEYRGYGGLPGVPTYEGSRLDARAAWKTAHEQLGVDSARIALHGHSLGTAVAAELAAEHPPRALLLMSPFTSAQAMARGMLTPPLAIMWPMISRIGFDTRARVAALHVPVSVVHGARDMVIPASMGRAVHAAALVKGALLIVPGAGHNDVVDVAADAYWQWMADALR